MLQTTFSNAFSWMKIYEFWLKFQRRLFLRVQSTIFQHWFNIPAPPRWQAIIRTNVDPVHDAYIICSTRGRWDKWHVSTWTNADLPIVPPRTNHSEIWFKVQNKCMSKWHLQNLFCLGFLKLMEQLVQRASWSQWSSLCKGLLEANGAACAKGSLKLMEQLLQRASWS